MQLTKPGCISRPELTEIRRTPCSRQTDHCMSTSSSNVPRRMNVQHRWRTSVPGDQRVPTNGALCQACAASFHQSIGHRCSAKKRIAWGHVRPVPPRLRRCEEFGLETLSALRSRRIVNSMSPSGSSRQFRPAHIAPWRGEKSRAGPRLVASRVRSHADNRHPASFAGQPSGQDRRLEAMSSHSRQV